jgi:hypothetical protein
MKFSLETMHNRPACWEYTERCAAARQPTRARTNDGGVPQATHTTTRARTNDDLRRKSCYMPTMTLLFVSAVLREMLDL